MTIKIDKKIVNAVVVVDADKPEKPVSKEPPLIKKKREDLLWGASVKIKTPDCNIYGSVNHDDDYRPLELFLSSSHLESMEWVALATRLASAMLKSSDSELASLDFIAKEFIKTESPRVYLGKVLDSKKGMMHNGVIPHIGKNLLAVNKRLRAKAKNKLVDAEVAPSKPVEPTKPVVSAGGCPECFSDNTTLMDNCLTCLDCGYSKCG